MGFPVIGSEGMFLTPQLCALGYRRWLQGSTVLHYFRQSSQSVFPSEKDQSAVIAHARRSVKFSGFQIFIHGMICLSDILLPHSDRHKSCSGRKTNKKTALTGLLLSCFFLHPIMSDLLITGNCCPDYPF